MNKINHLFIKFDFFIMVKWERRVLTEPQVYNMKFAELFIFSYCDKDSIFLVHFELHMCQEIQA